ncbi:MAG TPA: Glu/Leu/Phe/Val dehydrogenase [Chthoniobacteraceae bacterium]|jgi:glutamate dehydrogenase (NAD(P)+)
MEIYADPAYDMATEQFRVIADHLQIEESLRERMLHPKRAMAVTLPIHRDDGRIETFQGFRVQHHLALGPTKGGTRFHPSVTLGEVAALSMWMSWKCALTGLPYGGAKGGIAVDPRSLSLRELEALSRRYMQEMIPFVGPHTDIMGPDMGTNEQVMAWFMDTYSVYTGYSVPEIVTGKPVSVGGSAGRREATGRGVVYLIERALDVLKMQPDGCTAVVQGFGNVGAVTAHGLAYKTGMKVIGLSDQYGAYHRAGGIDVGAAERYAQTHGSLQGFTEADPISPDDLLTLRCDVLVPAAIEAVITEHNAGRLQCRILAEAANGPTTPAADRILFERWAEIFVIPDILCNAGGVVVSYFEWVQGLQAFLWNESEVMDRLFRILEQAFSAVTKRAREEKIPHRVAAMAIGVERVLAAKRARGLFP